LRVVGEGDGLEHERLGEEGAADGGLLLDGADAEGGKACGAGKAAGVEEEDGGTGDRDQGTGIRRLGFRGSGGGLRRSG
jgi:hypothetical protein